MAPDAQRVFTQFQERFGAQPQLYAAPGRINLIGEHTDYNLGWVLPAAIDKKIYFALRPNNTGLMRVLAADLGYTAEIPLAKIQPSTERWLNYPLGVVHQLQAAGLLVPGFDLVYGGDMPMGAGVSSSAAVEVGVLFALNDLFDLQQESLTLTLMAQRAEHEYAGVQCGIMDQFAVMFGREACALKLDCRSLAYEHIPLRLGDYFLVLCDSRVDHALAGTEYNTRRRECAAGIALMQKRWPVQSLRDVTAEQLASCRADLPEVIYRRCAFVLEENERVQQACLALSANRLDQLGQLLYASHAGLRDMYQVSCPEIDELVRIAQGCEGVAGARMMGGGFGGCTINLVQEDALPEFVAVVGRAYYQPRNLTPNIIVTKVSGGVQRLL